MSEQIIRSDDHENTGEAKPSNLGEDGLIFDDDPFTFEDWNEDDIALTTSEKQSAIDPRETSELNDQFDDFTVQLFAEYNVAGIVPRDIPESEERAKYERWLGSLDENTQLILGERKRASGRHEVVKNEILKSAPFLLEGKLSSEQARQLGADEYILGINQSGTSSLGEALDYLKEENGIGLGIYGLDQRFLLIDDKSVAQDREYGEHAIIDGYYGNSDLGRFVVAIPMKSRTEYTTQDANEAYNAIEDFTQPTAQDGGRSVSPRYIAGYIDNTGKYYENRNLGLSTEPLFE